MTNFMIFWFAVPSALIRARFMDVKKEKMVLCSAKIVMKYGNRGPPGCALAIGIIPAKKRLSY